MFVIKPYSSGNSGGKISLKSVTATHFNLMLGISHGLGETDVILMIANMFSEITTPHMFYAYISFFLIHTRYFEFQDIIPTPIFKM